MFSRLLKLMVLAFFIVPTFAIAATTAAQPANTPSTDEVVREQAFANLTSMLIGCELDNKCLLLMLIEVVKNDPAPIYQAFLNSLLAQKKQIEFEAQNCNIPELQQVKKTTATCLSKTFARFQGKTTLPGVEGTSQDAMNACMKGEMSAMAKIGNIYAQGAMINYAKRVNDKSLGEHWNIILESRQGTPEYELFQKCNNELKEIGSVPGQ